MQKCKFEKNSPNFDYIDLFIYSTRIFLLGSQNSKTMKVKSFYTESCPVSFRASLEFYSQKLLTPQLKVSVFLINIIGCEFN